MEELTQEQLDFLKAQNIHLKYVFNAKGLSKSDYRVIMKELNKLVAYNVAPCQKDGHTLRTRSGHCCQCNTANIEFQKRNDSAGIVYIAASKLGQLVKIGFSKAVEVRAKSLNTTKYAGFYDWEILYAIKSDNAGRIETKSNSLLREYAFSLNYDHDNHWQDSHETYHCSYSKARQLVEKAIQDLGCKFVIERNVTTDNYEFKNLRRL